MMRDKIVFGIVLLALLTSVNVKAESVPICNDVPCYVPICSNDVPCYVEGMLNFGSGILVPDTGGVSVSGQRAFYVHHWNSTTHTWDRAACPITVENLKQGAYQIPISGDGNNAIYAAVSAAFYADLPISISIEPNTCQVSSVELLPRLSGHQYGVRKNSGVTAQ